MWQQVKAFREQQAKALADAKAIMSKAETEKRSMTAEETTQFDTLCGEAESRKADIERIERAMALDSEINKRSGNQPGRDDTGNDPSPFGFETRDLKGYSILRAIRARVEGRPLDGLEKEVSDEIAKRSGKSANGFFFPTEIAFEKRALDLTAGAGAKATVTDAANFIELLRDRTVLNALGARILTGLQGDLSLPKQTAGGSSYWVTEGNAPTASNATIGQVGFTPKTVGATTELSRKFILQSSVSAEQFAREDLAAQLAIAIDKAALAGSGTGAEPTGLLNLSSVPTTALGTNGAALTFANLVALETAVANANADLGNLAYVTNSKVRGKLKITDRGTDTGKYIWADDKTVNGYQTAVTNLMPSNLTKGTSNGVCSAVLFGNWNDLVLGFWGALDITVDPYSSSTTGAVKITALQDCDLKPRHAESFAKIVDALTA